MTPTWPFLQSVRSLQVFDLLTATMSQDAKTTIVVLHSGLIVLAMGEVVSGDTIALVHGSKLPFFLRWHGDGIHFVGLAYIHGIMNDELLKVWQGVELIEHQFVLC